MQPITVSVHFNSQPHKEADGLMTGALGETLAFQLTASQGGWPVKKGKGRKARYFNSQPHKEADRFSQTQETLQNYFNSQPHKEADAWDAGVPMRLPISTHSLTRRLTECSWTKGEYDFISTHSLTRRLTHKPYKAYLEKLFQLTASQGGWRAINNTGTQKHVEFQLTASQGGWRTIIPCVFRTNYISTHSLTRRLTNRKFASESFIHISTHSLTRRLTICIWHQYLG